MNYVVAQSYTAKNKMYFSHKTVLCDTKTVHFGATEYPVLCAKHTLLH